MYSITEKASDSLQPPDLKPALQLFEKSISNTIIKWFNDNQKSDKKESLVYNHLLNNPMVVGLSLQISSLEKQLEQANKRIEELVSENNNLKLHVSDTKNVTLDITEIIKNNDDSNDNDTVVSTDIQDDNQKHLNQVVKKLESYACGYNIVSADNSDEEENSDDEEDSDNNTTTPYVMGALLVQNNTDNIDDGTASEEESEEGDVELQSFTIVNDNEKKEEEDE